MDKVIVMPSWVVVLKGPFRARARPPQLRFPPPRRQVRRRVDRRPNDSSVAEPRSLASPLCPCRMADRGSAAARYMITARDWSGPLPTVRDRRGQNSSDRESARAKGYVVVSSAATFPPKTLSITVAPVCRTGWSCLR